ncbi:uncharacterized protein LOC110036064 [Phalaenopsis equestris]|uniref:uncharacterized protein LOC110022677 n=1 Tax=Phalaenopsis equestris TaxID=78828 RepID=UPI0009E2024F|nr:uncharacterized protein LOC110022677 [Phalaenopsis equestris]XP_020596070.1 uncharacterized protein LOC110036064 [Phalaenopsis equestris]
MGFVSGAVDSIILLFSAVLLLAVPLIDAQSCFPAWFFHPALLDLRRWYIDEFGDYLLKEKPHFLIGLTWIEIVFIWPLSIANVYGILARRPWVATTSLMVGVSIATSMAAVMAELLGSDKSPDKLLQMYCPFVAFSVLAILKGLFPGPLPKVTKASHAPSARKKRA